MSDQISNSPPPIPNDDEPPEIIAKPNEWYYVFNGVKKGPVSATAIRDLLSGNQIETDTQVWRKGMNAWKNIRESDLAEFVASDPPAISPDLIGNGYVWTLAIFPLVFGFIDASIAYSDRDVAELASIIGAHHNPPNGLPWQIPLAINGILGLLDERRLMKAGYGSKWMRAAAVLLIPVYLFVRAKKLR